MSIVLSALSKRIHFSLGPRRGNRDLKINTDFRESVESLGRCTKKVMRYGLSAEEIELFEKLHGIGGI